jgi:hypothetical protein
MPFKPPKAEGFRTLAMIETSWFFATAFTKPE